MGIWVKKRKNRFRKWTEHMTADGQTRPVVKVGDCCDAEKTEPKTRSADRCQRQPRQLQSPSTSAQTSACCCTLAHRHPLWPWMNTCNGCNFDIFKYVAKLYNENIWTSMNSILKLAYSYSVREILKFAGWWKVPKIKSVVPSYFERLLFWKFSCQLEIKRAIFSLKKSIGIINVWFEHV